MVGLVCDLYKYSMGCTVCRICLHEVSGSFASVQPSIDSLDGKIIRSDVSAPHKLSKAEQKLTLPVIVGNLQHIFFEEKLDVGCPLSKEGKIFFYGVRQANKKKKKKRKGNQ